MAEIRTELDNNGRLSELFIDVFDYDELDGSMKIAFTFGEKSVRVRTVETPNIKDSKPEIITTTYDTVELALEAAVYDLIQEANSKQYRATVNRKTRPGSLYFTGE